MGAEAEQVTVIANCHSLPLAEAMALFLGQGRVDFLDINFLQSPESQNKIAQLHTQGGKIFTQNLSDKFGKLETKELRSARGKDVVSFTNIYFTGLHPDITYLGQMGRRIQSPLRDYHSKLVLFAFAAGRTEDECLSMFNGQIFEKIGYLDEFEKSATSLRERDDALDIKFADRFLDRVRKVPSLLTINHPTAEILGDLAEMLLSSVGAKFTPAPQWLLQNQLAASVIWPIYDEIAEFHGLSYRTPQCFFRARSAGQPRALALKEFIQDSYLCYRDPKLTDLTKTIRNLPFFSEFAIKLGS